MTFEGKSVIITGAGKGIGRACARNMAARGAEVVALSRTQSDLDSLHGEIGGRGLCVDLQDTGATRTAMAAAGPCDFLVNCAGVNVLESVLEMSEAGYEAVLGINLRAALICSQVFARARIAAGRRRCDCQCHLHRRAPGGFRTTCAMPRPRQGWKAPAG